MTEEQSPIFRHIVRFGLPIVILVFYLTASLGFNYTPDSTYFSLQFVKNAIQGGELGPTASGMPGATPSPLWVLLLAIGEFFRLDVLLVSKVFSLFFSCLAILCAYLFAMEVVSDRLLSFSVALIVAMQSWLLQAAPSGSALSLALLLSLTTLFLTLRNEYILAAFVAGLCSMVCWQAAGLLVIVSVDIFLNSLDKRRGLRVILMGILAFCTAILPWVLFSVFSGAQAIPQLIPIDELPSITFSTGFALAVLVMMMVSGPLLLLKAGVSMKRIVQFNVGPALWMAWLLLAGVAGNSELLFLVIPLLCVYAFLGLQQILRAARRQRSMYALTFLLTGILLAQNQLAWISITRPLMATATERAEELKLIAVWLNATVGGDGEVTAERRGVLEYYAHGPIGHFERGTPPTSEYVVTTTRGIDGYEISYDPSGEHLGNPRSKSGHFLVWKRK